jgi:type IV pilus assembly protein PilA
MAERRVSRAGTMRRRGFTMLEMMAVLAVVAILATLAVPSYLEQIVREQIKTAIPLADIAKVPVAAAWRDLQAFPADNAAAGLPPAARIVSNHVSAVGIKDGAITITFGNRASTVIAGKMITLRPAVVEDAPVVPIAWVCGYAEAPQPMTVIGENATNIPPGLLPFDCRALAK